jgi:hypothetical protein
LVQDRGSYSERVPERQADAGEGGPPPKIIENALEFSLNRFRRSGLLQKVAMDGKQKDNI